MNNISESEAKKILEQYISSPYDLDRKGEYQNAANLIYGKGYEICETKVDLSSRIYFYCVVCNKEMNSIQSLEDHARCGSHTKKFTDALKNNNTALKKSFKTEENSEFTYKERKNMDPNCLQYLLDTSPNSYILGLQKVEEYVHHRGRCYYVCFTCQVHGKVNDMFRHLIGDKHTDKYLRSVLNLVNSNITSAERHYLREEVFKKEDYRIRDIVTIRCTNGHRKLYPYALEDEAKKSWKKPNSTFQRGVNEGASTSRFEPMVVEAEPEVLSDIDYKLKSYRNPSPPSSRRTSEDEFGRSTNVLDNLNNFDKLLDTLKIFIDCRSDPGSQLKNAKEVCLCLRMMFACLHFLFFATKTKLEKKTLINIRKENESDHPSLVVIKKCLGRITENLQAIVHQKYGIDLQLGKKRDRHQPKESLPKASPLGNKWESNN